MNVVTETLPTGIGVIAVSGPLLSEQELEGLRKAIREYVDREEKKLLIDLGGVTYLNSSAMALLVSAHTTYSKRHWQLKLCNIHKNAYVVFAVTRLDKVFSIIDSRNDAVESFARHH
jgi:anti-sigma B factor antagonist